MSSLLNKTEENIIESLADLSKHKYNLYQQFFIVGLDPELMLKINDIDLKMAPQPYLFPKVISKVPPNDLYYLNIPDNVIASHCFPNGIRKAIIDYNDLNYESSIKYQNSFVFSLENQYIIDKACSLRTNRVYFSCLLFYEDIENYRECINYKNQKLKKLVNIPNDADEIKNNGILIPKIICLSSFKPFFEQSKLILENLKKYVDNYLYSKISKDNFNIYPIEKIIEGLIYNLPALPRANIKLKLNKDIFETCLNKVERKSTINDIDDNKNKLIFYESSFNRTPKNIINYSILMRYFRINEVFEIILFILLEEPILFFCEDIHVLTYIIEGLISLIYPFEYQYPIVSVLPEENYSLISIFKHFIFGINYKYSDELIQKKGITLEDKKFIIIVRIEKRFEKILNSSEEDKLKYSVITSIRSDETKPFVKIEQDKMGDFAQENIVKEIALDKKKMYIPMHYFEKCTKRLEKRTAERFKEFSSKNKKHILKLEEKEHLFNIEIRRTFIYFFSCILLNYQSFCVKYERKIEVLTLNDSNNNNNNNKYLDVTLITNSKPVNSSKEDKDFDFFFVRKPDLEEKFLLNKLKINDIFSCKNFLEDIDTPSLDRPFYKKLFETQIFFKFIKKKIFPNSIQDKLDILYFDNKVNEKLLRSSRKIKANTKYFIADIENLNREININSFKKEPSEKMKDFLNNKKNICNKKAINYFQIISKKKNILINHNNNNNSDNEIINTELGLISQNEVYEGFGTIKEDSKSNSSAKIDILNKDHENNTIDAIDEINNNKLIFTYFVFPKLLNDEIFYKGNDLLEEFEKESICLIDKNDFNINNCNYLYNQFEKEASNFIKNPIIQQNYVIYDYDINVKYKYKYEYDECINKLWILYLAKIFHSISFSKKRYYFEEILMFLNDTNNKVDQNTILLLFNSINQHGDKSMNQELFMFLKKKNYINFLSLREKAKPENNFMKYINNNNMYNYNLKKLRDSFHIRDTINDKLDVNEEKINQNINKKLFDFIIYSYCSPDLNEKKNIDIDIDLNEENLENLDLNEIRENENSITINTCGEHLNINIKELFESQKNKKYIEVKCPKCNKIQNISISCFFSDDNDNKFQLNFNLISPLALQKEPWFQNNNKLDILYISREYPEEYLSAIFYFYEQGLPCNFLVPKGIPGQEVIQDRATTYNNIDPIEEYLYSIRLNSHKKSFNYFYKTPRISRKDGTIHMPEKLSLCDFKKARHKTRGRKSPSPKKSPLMKKSNLTQKFKKDDFDIKPKIVTFSCFKK